MLVRNSTGEMKLVDMVVVDEGALASQMERFLSVEQQTTPRTGTDAEAAVHEPYAVAVDDRIEALCRASRVMTERASSNTRTGGQFEEFTPVDAMSLPLPDGTVFYVKLRTGGTVVGSSRAHASEHVAIKLFETLEGALSQS